MSTHFRIGACALIASGVLALPAAANAADIQTAVSAVQAHTTHADAALDRAVSLFGKNHDKAARITYAKSRKEMGLAKAAAAKARHQANTPNEHALAAAAAVLVATEQGENIEKLARAMRKGADGADENKIAAAARADTKGRDKAIAILNVLMGELPDQAQVGIAKAIAALSVDRADETQAEALDLVSSKVSKANKGRVVETIEASVDGQAKAAETLAALIANPDTPAAALPGLQTAYDAVIADHGSVADILGHFSENMPGWVHTFVEQIITQAHTDAQGMKDNHPTGPPAGHPGGPPATVPGPPFS